MATLDYELILMLDPQAGDDAREKVAADAKSKLEAAGEVKHEANWGTRRMAYEIDRRGEADYRVWRFTGGKDLLDDLDHSLKITDGVLRFRIFKVPADSPNIVPPDTEQIMRRDEDDRERGRGRGRDGDRDRGPRRPRSDSGPAADGGSTAPAETPAKPPAGDDASAPAKPPAGDEAPAPATAPAGDDAPAPATPPAGDDAPAAATAPAGDDASAPATPPAGDEAPAPAAPAPDA